MGTGKAQPKQPSKDGGPVDETRRPDPAELQRRIAICLLDLEKELLYKDGVQLHQFRMTKKEDAWLLMLKGDRKGRRLIAFVAADSFAATLIEGVTSSDCGYIRWRDDRPTWER